ncbi:gamma carbonic anhydrase family protein [Agromyces aerolatus]|uniref:gamma carbonic anhydrase family protein n=1 Tax=Agromyces sp. LY-1074 TaxID=3074080 RepID=UPI00285CC3A5|nr:MULTISPECIES: gamma carbonic anhydrase family protein [unclassified Agromyces]MDR5698267.1 gamma carbonic anhydrase family protein [Agromyces sp. LY-1074]MDR5704561.1 gamma carbonic anhydrase family protein [Agromyces sp. LY-1358]
MSADPSARIIQLAGVPAPVLDESAFVAAGAVIVGDVRLEAGSSVWYNAVLRAEVEPIVLGADANLQDTVVCHVDAGFPLTVGAGVSVGHGAVLHGCTIEADCLIGMSATVLNGAVIGAGSLVAAGAVVLEGTVVPPGSLVAGVPAKVRRELTDEERAGIRRNAESYLRNVVTHTTPVD